MVHSSFNSLSEKARIPQIGFRENGRFSGLLRESHDERFLSQNRAVKVDPES